MSMIQMIQKTQTLRSSLSFASLARFSRFEKVVYKESPTSIIDYSKLIFCPQEKLQFQKDGKCLLYFYQPRVNKSICFNMISWTIPGLSFDPLLTFKTKTDIYWNFPKSKVFHSFLLHLHTNRKQSLLFDNACIDAFLLYRPMFPVVIQQSNMRRIPQEIYLLEDGETIEVVWLKQFYRKLKGDPLSQTFHVTQLASPQTGEQFRPLSGDVFPGTYPFQDIVPMKYAWTKYYFTPQQYFYIPKYCNYINMEVLVNAFNGKIINTSKDYTEEIDYQLKDKYTNL